MSELDPVIHPLNRFKICAVLNAAGELLAVYEPYEGRTKPMMVLPRYR